MAAKKEEKKDTKPKLTKEQLLSKLDATEDQTEKRKLRARLRTLGHKGGLNRPRKTVAKKAAAKKGKRAKKEAVPA